MNHCQVTLNTDQTLKQRTAMKTSPSKNSGNSVIIETKLNKYNIKQTIQTVTNLTEREIEDEELRSNSTSCSCDDEP